MRRPILVVEDYADLRFAIVSTLERRDYACASVAGSEEAVEWLRGHDPSAILLSPRPTVADDPVIRYLAANRPEDIEKVIVMSDPETQSDGCDRLEKPFTNDELFARLGIRS